MSRDIAKLWTVKFAKPPVIHQIHQGFPLPKIHAIWYIISLTNYIAISPGFLQVN